MAVECAPRTSQPQATRTIVGCGVRPGASAADRFAAAGWSVTALHETGTKVPVLCMAPVPRAPSAPSPQEKRPPKVVTRRVWRAEHATAATASAGRAPSTGQRTFLGVAPPLSQPRPRPRHPASFSPQDHTSHVRGQSPPPKRPSAFGSSPPSISSSSSSSAKGDSPSTPSGSPSPSPSSISKAKALRGKPTALVTSGRPLAAPSSSPLPSPRSSASASRKASSAALRRSQPRGARGIVCLTRMRTVSAGPMLARSA